jgi:hypothetical protein
MSFIFLFGRHLGIILFPFSLTPASSTCTVYIGGSELVPPLVMDIQTGSTNNHISQIFFVFAAPMYWLDWLASPN